MLWVQQWPNLSLAGDRCPCRIASVYREALGTGQYPAGMISAHHAVAELVASATGRAHREDPALPRTGGPAGNAQLTAWLGLLLLALSIAELVTLLDVTGLISWHIVIGVLLVPPALAKTASTGWRILRYYAGNRPYVTAGPPPLLLRVLGPLVVLTTLLVLGTGLALIALGPSQTFATLVTVLGQQISPLTLHQASFIGWAVATGLHVLARLLPAARLAVSAGSGALRPAGVTRRGVALLATVAVGAIAAPAILGVAGAWSTGDLHRFHHHREGLRPPAGTVRPYAAPTLPPLPSSRLSPLLNPQRTPRLKEL